MGGGEAMIVAGIGCRRGCPADEILAVVRSACAAARQAADAVAAPAFKSGEMGLHDAARALGVPLLWVSADELAGAQAKCATRSAVAERATGVASVAEGCALAAAGAASRLVLARIVAGRATCALAEGVP